MPRVYVYAGPGAGQRSLLSAVQALREALLPLVEVCALDADDLLAGGWREGCLLLAVPGGADLPYCKHLNGRGCTMVREWVESGGRYLGLCAGAYFGSAACRFEPGTRLEVVGPRELAFFPGTAAGSVYPGFCYSSEGGAVAAPLRFRCLPPPGGGTWPAGWPDSAAADAACPQTRRQPVAAEAAGAVRSGGEASPAPAAAQRQRAPAPPPRQAEPPWEPCADYFNGGPAFVEADHWEGVEVLAVYADAPAEAAAAARGALAAAVLCRAGAGRAVLCGTHPELSPAWLGGDPGSESDGSSRRGVDVVLRTGDGDVAAWAAVGPAPPAEAPTAAASAALLQSPPDPPALADPRSAAHAAHVARLRRQLEAAQPARRRYWRSLLVAAGLGPWLSASSAALSRP
eukprot:scaffold10.g2281.t1